MPLTTWNFKRYGRVITGSVEADLAGQWDSITGGKLTYQSSLKRLANTIDAFEGIASSRNACYLYPSGSVASKIYDDTIYVTEQLATAAGSAFTAQYPAVASGTYSSVAFGSGISYMFYTEYKPAFMMMLAYAAAGDTPVAFAIVDMPDYLKNARNAVVAFRLSNGMEMPHYCESYYLLASNLSG